MEEFDEINSKNDKEKNKKLIEFYKDKVNINSWLTNDIINNIIKFKDRTEYKKFGYYHRLNGPAIDYENPDLDKYYYKGKLFEKKEDWDKAIIREVRKIKLKKIKESKSE
ncbi:hypothetical protein M0Q97_05695 [Candidatus Dojkabacteria bacterium]|jgi:hypothetical protein|nr:hypothetical protein [Candidatus Dojkabacteria bacterium]